MKRILACLLALLLATTALAEPADKQAWLDGPLTQGAGTTAEWYVLALAQTGEYDFTAYRAALRAYLDSRTVRSATTRLKYALVLAAIGGTSDPYVAETLDASIGQQGVMSWAYGLHLINNGIPCKVTADAAIDALLSLRFADGGWALMGTAADVDVTAMVVQTLAPHRAARADVAEAIDGAVTLLSGLQQPNGGYMSYGVANPESAGQVLVALAALRIDGLADPRFIKEGTLRDAIERYRLPDGTYAHQAGGPSNQNATAQTYLAYAAYQRFLDGKGSIYLLDASPESNPVPETHPLPETYPVADWGYKPIATAIILGAAGVACFALLLSGKRHRKNFLAVGIAAAVALAVVFAVDFQSADDYYAITIDKPDAIGQVTLAIRCDAVAGRADFIPADGIILAETAFPICAGDTVYTILTEAARAHRIHLENSGGPASAYISGLGYLYEHAYGGLSGWLYRVNGEGSSLGCDQYALRDGDAIEWLYTLEMGNDLK